MLPNLFSDVVIPPGVAAGLSTESARRLRVELSHLGFIQVRAPCDNWRVEQLCLGLHRGESEALALAIEIRPEYVLLDDRAAREVATQVGLVPVGALGVVVRAKRAGLVAAVTPLIDLLEREISFRVSPEARRRILELAEE